MQRDVEWKASQLVFLAQWAYFTPSASKVFSSAAKETFHRALDHPCKKLEDLSTFLSKSFDQVNKLVDVDGEITDEVRFHFRLVNLALKLFFSTLFEIGESILEKFKKSC